MIRCVINNIELEVPDDCTILEAARSVEIYIPTICSHPDLPPFHSLELSETVYKGENKFTNETDASIESISGCGLCIVQVKGEEELISSCKTKVKDGMKITVDGVKPFGASGTGTTDYAGP